MAGAQTDPDEHRDPARIGSVRRDGFLLATGLRRYGSGPRPSPGTTEFEALPRAPRMLQDVARLAVQHLADAVERLEANALHLALFQQRQVGLGDTHLLRQVARLHLAGGQHDVEGDDNGHQTNSAFSRAMPEARAMAEAITHRMPAPRSASICEPPRSRLSSLCPGGLVWELALDSTGTLPTPAAAARRESCPPGCRAGAAGPGPAAPTSRSSRWR